MRLIRSIQIDKFRSFDTGRLDDLSENVVLVGPNNSGKSNVLRALSLYFNDEVEPPQTFLEIDRDYHIPSRLSKKKREIAVTVEFDLPKAFRLRKKLEEVEKLLGRHFWLRKSWTLESFDASLFYSPDGASFHALDSHKAGIARQFLGLISFRYVPNRVDHTNIIRQESPALQRILAKRIANHSKEKVEPLLVDLKKFAKNMVDPIASAMSAACTGITDVELGTPVALFDMLLPSGFKASIGGGGKVDDAALGAGAQSLLMFHVLHMIDQHEFQNFGWRQAAIWAVEEPESSLHRELQVRLAAMFRGYAGASESRFQILSTTHSDIFVYGASSGFLVNVAADTSTIRPTPIPDLAAESSASQISSWTQPALKFPLDPVVLVEGPTDQIVLRRAAELLGVGTNLKFLPPSQLDSALGDGKDNVADFVKRHSLAIGQRLPRQPLLALVDWDVSDGNLKNIAGPLGGKAIRMDAAACDPRVGASFRGIERFFSERLLTAGEASGVISIARKGTGELVVTPADLAGCKVALAAFFVANAAPEDCKHIRPALDSLASLARGGLV